MIKAVFGCVTVLNILLMTINVMDLENVFQARK